MHRLRERAIVHLNVADFAVAVERRIDRRLEGRPVIIAPEGAGRAVVYDMSEEAYRCGVCKGMSLSRALGYCPDARVLTPHPRRYAQAVRRFFSHVAPYTPLVEIPDVKGHLFLDVTGVGRLFGPPPDVAWRIRKAVRTDMGLDPIWAVAPNKLVAKVATRLVKPTGEYIVGAGDEAAFLAPLPLRLIPGIDSEDLRRFEELNLTRAGDVAGLTMGQLEVLLDRRAPAVYQAVRGIDRSPVLPAGRVTRQVCADHVFGEDTNDAGRIQAVLYRLVEKTCAELRRKRMVPRTLAVTVEYSDGRRCARRSRVDPPCAIDFRVFQTAESTLFRAWHRRVRIRCLRLVCFRLTHPSAQLPLFPAVERKARKDEQLITAIDRIRTRFGRDAVQIGRTLAA